MCYLHSRILRASNQKVTGLKMIAPVIAFFILAINADFIGYDEPVKTSKRSTWLHFIRENSKYYKVAHFDASMSDFGIFSQVGGYAFTFGAQWPTLAGGSVIHLEAIIFL